MSGGTGEGFDLDDGYPFGVAELHQSKLGNIKQRKGGAEIHCQDICLIKMMYLTRKIVLTQLINLIESRKRVWACFSTRSLSSARVSLYGRTVERYQSSDFRIFADNLKKWSIFIANPHPLSIITFVQCVCTTIGMELGGSHLLADVKGWLYALSSSSSTSQFLSNYAGW